jgi:hypothetical protein
VPDALSPEISVPPDRKRLLRTLAEGQRFEAYAEQQTAEMKVCFLCERVYYRRKPMKKVGQRWLCIDCLRGLKESLDTLDDWEKRAVLHDELEQNVGVALKK